MVGSELGHFSFWWIIPIVMIIVCFLMMRGRRGSMMCGPWSCNSGHQPYKDSDSALDILDKRYASGEIDTAEYQEIKNTLTQQTGFLRNGE